MRIPNTDTQFSSLHPDDWEPYFDRIDEWRATWAAQRPAWVAKLEGMPEDPGPRPRSFMCFGAPGVGAWQAKADRYFAWFSRFSAPAFTEAPAPAGESELHVPLDDFAIAHKRDAGVPDHRKYRIPEAHRAYFYRRTLINDDVYRTARLLVEQIRHRAAHAEHAFDAPSSGFGYGGYDD